MKALVIYAHPNPKSFCSAIRQKVEEILSQKGISYHVRDLYSMNFDPILSGKDFESLSRGEVISDVAKEQELIRESDLLIFIFPMWWYSFPAILKGYIDRVFSYGFAYAEEDGQIRGLLQGKRAMILCTLGGSEQDYGSFADCIKSIFSSTFTFCGLEVPSVEFFYAVPYVGDDVRKAYLKKVEELLSEL